MYILKQNLLCCLILSFFSFQQNKILWSADTNSAWGFLLEIHFQKNFDSMFSRNFYFRIGVKVLLFFPWRGENRPQPALLAKPLQKSNKMARNKKKRKYTTLGNHYPFCIKSDSRVVLASIWKMGLREVEQGIHWTYLFHTKLAYCAVRTPLLHH